MADLERNESQQSISNPLLERIKRGEEVFLYEIRNDLRARCNRIPFYAWRAQFPDMQIPLFEHLESELLPKDKSVKTKGTRHVIGQDVVQDFLTKDGRILQKLVHYDSDDYDSSLKAPDEILGDGNLEIYSQDYSEALTKLETVNQKAQAITPK